MNQPLRITLVAASIAAIGACLAAQTPTPVRPASATPVQLPDGAGKDTAQRVCGTTCHGAELMMGRGRSREQWTQVVTTMVTRGAKATDSELVQIVDYLAKTLSPSAIAAR